MVTIYWTNQAVNDLKAIYDYIARDSMKYAKIHVSRIKLATHILKSHPKSGKVVTEFQNENIREIIVKNYRIIYAIKSSSQINILLIHHGNRILENR